MDVYLAALAAMQEEEVSAYRAMLDAREVARADRYVSAPARKQFVVGRGLLRWLVAGVWGTTPPRVRLETTPAGKPYLVPPEPDLFRFVSVSHCPTRVALAVCRSAELAVDVEWTERRVDIETLARFSMSDRERSGLRVVAQAERRCWFFRHWTLKEACVKALGTGLATDLRSVECRFEEGSRSFEFRYPQQGGIGLKTMAARQYRVSETEWMALAVGSDGVPGPLAARVFRVLPGFRVQLIAPPHWTGAGAARGAHA